MKGENMMNDDKEKMDLMDSLLREHARMKREGENDEALLQHVEGELDKLCHGGASGISVSESSIEPKNKRFQKNKLLWIAASAVIGYGVYHVSTLGKRSKLVALDSSVVHEQVVEEAQLEKSVSQDRGLVFDDENRVASMPMAVAPKKPVPPVAMREYQKGDVTYYGPSSSPPTLSPRVAPQTKRKVANRFAGTRPNGEVMEMQWMGGSLKGEQKLGEYMLSDKSVTGDQYGRLVENQMIAPLDKKSKRSTFAVDVDTASYANLRQRIRAGLPIPKDSVRIEELVNYFDYHYPQPSGDEGAHPFAVKLDAVVCPWNADHQLVRIAIQGKDVVRSKRPAANLVFLIDVSGSMRSANKLPLLKQSLQYLLEELNERDSVSIVVYAGASGLALPATKVTAEGRQEILTSFAKLSAGGSTAGGQGIKLAYQVANDHFIKGGVNRVILATDGDFNVGVHDDTALTKLVKAKAKDGVYLSVLGFGRGNLNDKMLEAISNNGNGNYSYIDSLKEGRKVLLEDMMGTMVTIAKDVKVQVEMNPLKVKKYRLIGYSNRVLPNRAFLDKRADAGEIGAGHTVTAFYEIVRGEARPGPVDSLRYAKQDAEAVEKKKIVVPEQYRDEILFVKLAYKLPQQKVNDESTYFSVALKDQAKPWEEADADFKFASAVALFGMVIRESDFRGDGDLDLVLKLAMAGKSKDGKGMRAEFIELVEKLKERRSPMRR